MVESPFESFFGTDEIEAEYFVSVQAGGQTIPKSTLSSFTSSEKNLRLLAMVQWAQIRKKCHREKSHCLLQSLKSIIFFLEHSGPKGLQFNEN